MDLLGERREVTLWRGVEAPLVVHRQADGSGCAVSPRELVGRDTVQRLIQADTATALERRHQKRGVLSIGLHAPWRQDSRQEGAWLCRQLTLEYRCGDRVGPAEVGVRPGPRLA